jgi:release factor glutamine methyltransferase
MDEPRSDDGAPSLTTIATELRRVGVPVLALCTPESLGGPQGFRDKTFELLVPRDRRTQTLRYFETLQWRYHLGTSGAWRLLPAANYWWPATNVFVYWGLPALPFPARMLGRLERALWRGARPHPGGYLEPDAAALLVHLAFQASRPGVRYHRDDFDHLVECRRHIDDWERVWRIARAAGLEPAVRAALAAADEAGAERPRDGPVFGGPLGPAWRAATVVQRRARPAPLKALLAGKLHLGDAPVRCRMAGVELLTGPQIFVPTPDADLFVELTLARIAAAEHPTVLEAGTGSGGIALAVARAHPTARVLGADTSAAAIRFAKRNARRLGLRNARFYRGSVLEPFAREQLAGGVAVILANLPFYPARDYAPIGAVPRDTIEGQDDDGLGLLRTLARDGRDLLEPGGVLIMQMFAWQWEQFAPELAAAGYAPGEPLLTGPFAICPAELP